ncbi:MAG: putative DNA-binding WGR domain protein [Verrucomicrobiales bacterium]|jgi:predicted DNA-binding WGR domain protein
MEVDNDKMDDDRQSVAEIESLGVLDFLHEGIDRGGFETDDALAAVLPLMEQVLAIHEQGRVAPLDGLDALKVTRGQIWFENASSLEPRNATGEIAKLEHERSAAFEVVGSHDRSTDLDSSQSSGKNLLVANADDDAEHKAAVYLTRYASWEHAAGHHDALTDIYSLGMLAASLALGADFCDENSFAAFVEAREQLVTLQPSLHPSVARMLTRMTALKRSERMQDLATIIAFLKNYRDQPDLPDSDFSQIKGFRSQSTNDKRSLILARLRDRLFEISRRNRLVYFRQTLQTVNLTEGSVPLLMDYQNIRPEQLFTWEGGMRDAVEKEQAISLNRFLRFEDAPWLPGALDGIRRDANRDIKEYGFAQLRLVIVFLRWHNLKESPDERIHSPLLLMPVALTKKKGIRDSFQLAPSGTVAEVNPALRHFLKELYALDLPESIDLAETSVDVFFDLLRRQIQASEPAIELKKIDRPQIDLVYEKAKKRLDLFRQRQRMSGRAVKSWENVDYSYRQENFQPLGLQLFLKRVRPTPLPLDYLLSEKPQLRTPGMSNGGDSEVVEAAADPKAKFKKREFYQLRSGSGNNPYGWDFDLCSMTLGNFNYQKMTLVRDYNSLLEDTRENAAFDEIFSLEPRDREEPPPPSKLEDQFLIVPSDPTQVSAIAWSRTGRNLIIQGPPGTGKSQTITNLIADYVARGKRVLFVCEKRAALDVVYHRLGQSGLDRLACLIHDSQSDKKSFIQDLKATYEGFLSADEMGDQETLCTNLAGSIEENLAVLERFGSSMLEQDDEAGATLRELYQRLIALRGSEPEIDAETEESLPAYAEWLQHGEKLKRLTSTLRELGKPPIFATNPLSALGRGSFSADNPVSNLRQLLDATEAPISTLEELVDEIPFDLSEFTFVEWQVVGELCSAAQFLSEKKLLALLDADSDQNERYVAFDRKIEAARRRLVAAGEVTSKWKAKLSPRDTRSALDQAREMEKSILRFFTPAFWRLRKVMDSHYDLSAHAVKPRWSQLLSELDEEHQCEAKFREIDEEICVEFGIDDVTVLRESMDRFRLVDASADPSSRVAEFQEFIIAGDEPANRTVVELGELFPELQTLTGNLAKFVVGFESLSPAELAEMHFGLRANLELLPELLPDLNDLVKSSDEFFAAVSGLEWEVDSFEAAMARKSLNLRYRADRQLGRFEGWMLRRHAGKIDEDYDEWMGANGPRIINRVRRAFLDWYQIASLPAAQLSQEQKAIKKDFNKGRRELEHEFGKTMRYRSIRDLASEESGQVVLKLKPIWLMSPLSISDTLPLEDGQFDVVIYDEASQIKLEEAVPTAYRASQIIVVGDEMQLPPTKFFSSSSGSDEVLNIEDGGEVIEYDLGAESFLSHSAQNLPSTLLGWHYRSRHESLISFSNNAFYNGDLLTIPDRRLGLAGAEAIRVTDGEQAGQHTDGLLARSISYHFLEHGVYDNRRNLPEAEYIARTVKSLLERDTGMTIGIVAFSEAQQDEIELALSRLARLHEDFGNLLAAEYEREEDGQFCGLFVKNLENVQGDERDIILLSICYAPDHNGKMRMNFGPINQSGGEKRLNVIFSRARLHMVIVSSIHHHQITNEYNDGANCLKGFLEYSAAISRGDAETASRVLTSLDKRERFADVSEAGLLAVKQQIADQVEARGLAVVWDVGQSRFTVDLAISEPGSEFHRVAVLIDGDEHYAVRDPLERYIQRPRILRAFGWVVIEVLVKDWYHAPEEVLTKIERLVKDPDAGVAEETADGDESEPGENEMANVLKVAEPTEETTARRNVRYSGDTVEIDTLRVAEEIAPAASRTYLEFKSGSSEKFWELTRQGEAFTVRYGRVGMKGQSRVKEFPTATEAEREAEKQVQAKVRKGYQVADAT